MECSEKASLNGVLREGLPEEVTLKLIPEGQKSFMKPAREKTVLEEGTASTKGLEHGQREQEDQRGQPSPVRGERTRPDRED